MQAKLGPLSLSAIDGFEGALGVGQALGAPFEPLGYSG